MSQRQPFRFLELPAEIKLMIYTEVALDHGIVYSMDEDDQEEAIEHFGPLSEINDWGSVEDYGIVNDYEAQLEHLRSRNQLPYRFELAGFSWFDSYMLHDMPTNRVRVCSMRLDMNLEYGEVDNEYDYLFEFIKRMVHLEEICFEVGTNGGLGNGKYAKAKPRKETGWSQVERHDSLHETSETQKWLFINMTKPCYEAVQKIKILVDGRCVVDRVKTVDAKTGAIDWTVAGEESLWLQIGLEKEKKRKLKEQVKKTAR